MAKERIYELAKELKMPSKDLVNLAKKEGMDVKTHMSSVTSDEANKLRSMAKGAGKPATVKPAPKVQEHQSAPAKKEASRPANQGSQNNQNRDNRGNRNNNGNNNRHNSNNGSANANGNGGNQKRNQKRNQNNNNQGGQAANRNNNNGQGQGAHWFKKGKKNNKKKNRNKGNQRLRDTAPKAPTQRKDRPLPDVLEYTNGMNAQDLGKILHRSPAEIIKKLFMLGVMVNQNQSLDADTIEILAADYGIRAKEKVQVDVADLDHFFDERINNDANLADRPPVVTVMGHVDHGKTTLLDKIRHSHVTEGEAGGITQAIGAYQVKYNDKLITFLDTPGHAAFTEMRARGANITDITVLVVAADDGVMPQTIEAINHAKAAGTPIIVVVNKIDKPGANPDHVTEQLTEYGLIPEDWGGDTIYVKVSAKFGKNIDELLDMILLQAEVMELKANPDQNAAGAVVEARLDQGKGSVATLLVQQGTLHVGDPIVVGDTFGRVRTMTNENGRRIKDATPSTPVEITGLNGVPEAGDHFVVFDDEKTARAAGEERAKRAEDEKRRRTSHVTLDNLFDTMKKGEMKSLPIIIKADVQGSVEALAQSLQKIQVDGVRVDIIHKAVGAISESDVTLAEASNAIIIGFNVRPTPLAKSEAETNNIDIRLHRVIYNAIEEVEDAMKGMLEPVYEEEVLGQVEVRQLYKASKIGTIAGGMVVSGKITRDAKVRLIRDGVVIYEGELGSLKRFKDDAKEVKMGFECGLTIKNFNDVKENDVIEAYHMKEVPVK
ncbi:translation initiation factor IF-2 [Limosilactobacillus fermentum]|uniref:Translation initiation factor IF-2 n=1 Tax=Limosilactobacillus fermentum TaxID=1613 RepID=A0A2K2TLI3_LIMFE|nr:translation initiation factor IF-2 [Limosilactobacillus fermentum]KLD53907.1 translation initiation factor IF-2 [Limosilactobacillus fermentum]MCS8619359.1 translation initiation factor IF-2 [Limosilactobacillus fermentum]MCT3440390.1 translation initiation factor IF-2 [Limosilactobacillus fermentum]MCT3457416.1 translation initiation factor IF-2 [Limosilactobacillus fermentum]MDC6078401.1 translation initiation factor IF-2 [Limosilactobacillus fermentum]